MGVYVCAKMLTTLFPIRFFPTIFQAFSKVLEIFWGQCMGWNRIIVDANASLKWGYVFLVVFVAIDGVGIFALVV